MAKIMMPVEALDEYCVNCPELEIYIGRIDYFADPTAYVNKNHLCCSHLNRCLEIKRLIEENVNKKKDAT